MKFVDEQDKIHAYAIALFMVHNSITDIGDGAVDFANQPAQVRDAFIKDAVATIAYAELLLRTVAHGRETLGVGIPSINGSGGAL